MNQMAPSTEEKAAPDHVPATIFCSYAQDLEDEALLRKLEQHLSAAQREGRLVLWHQGRMVAGENREEVIKQWEVRASVILLLVSPAFLESNACDQQMRWAMQRHWVGETRVIPVILRPCDWSGMPFAGLECLPFNRKPITLWDNQDQAWQEVIEGLRQALPVDALPATHWPNRDRTLQNYEISQPREKKRLPIFPIILIIATALLSLTTGLVGNVTVNEFPPLVTPYLRYVWPLLTLLTFAEIGLAIWQTRTEIHSQPVSLGVHTRGRKQLLAKVRTNWITGFRNRSLQDTLPLVLKLGEHFDGVTHPWQLTLQLPMESTSSLPLGARIVDIYDAAGGELVLLGAAGSGKTILLLNLAQSLLDRAENHLSKPIPVVFLLSAWAVKRQPIADWLVEELNAQYQVPQQLAQWWIKDDQILPLFDGLDEVPLAARSACVEALNAYRREHTVSMVVCSRSNDYFLQRSRLQLTRAVVVQPLTQAQIHEYLTATGPHAEGIRAMLQQDPLLQELITTPLMLNIVMQTYREVSATPLQTASSLEALRNEILAAYVTRKLTPLRNNPPSYNPKQTCHQLGWLARQMIVHQQAQFHIERLQMDWIPSGWGRWLYPSLGIGLIYGLLIGLIYGFLDGISNLTYAFIVAGSTALLNGLVYGLLNGFVYGELDKQRGKVRLAGDDRTPRRTLSKWLETRFVYGLIFGLLNGLLQALLLRVTFGPVDGTIHGLGSGLFAGILVGLLGKVDAEIKPAEVVRWSWPRFQQNIFPFFGLGLLSGVAYILIYQQPERLILGLTASVIFSSTCGLSYDLFETQRLIAPNQGILRSARNSLKSSIISLFYGWLLYGIVFGAFYGTVNGMIYGFPMGLGLALWVGLQGGGQASLQHLILRFLLWDAGFIPWDYQHFLDYAAGCGLLQKVGGGYIFGHPLLSEHFATYYNALPSPLPVAVLAQSFSDKAILPPFLVVATRADESSVISFAATLPAFGGSATSAFFDDAQPSENRVFSQKTSGMHIVVLMISPHAPMPHVIDYIWSAQRYRQLLVCLWIGGSDAIDSVLKIGEIVSILDVRDGRFDSAIQKIIKLLEQESPTRLLLEEAVQPKDIPSSLSESLVGRGRLPRRRILAIVAGLGVTAGVGMLSWLSLSFRSFQLNLLYAYRGHVGTVRGVTWSPKGRMVASGSDDHTVQVWDAFTGRRVLTYLGHSGRKYLISAVAWSPDGRWIASGGSGDDRTVQVWNAQTGHLSYTYQRHHGDIRSLAWSHDGTRIASASNDHTVHIWDAADGTNLYIYLEHHTAVLSVAWSPDGNHLASSGPREEPFVRVWNATNGSTLTTYQGHTDSVNGVAWSPNGQFIVSAGGDGTAQVWDAKTGDLRYTFYGHNGAQIMDANWSPNPSSNLIVTGGTDGRILVWSAFDEIPPPASATMATTVYKAR